MTCIVAYDIEDNRVRARVAKFLESKGKRIQKSVFALEVERHAFKGLCRQIHKIAGKYENVAIIRLCGGCRDHAIHLGPEEPHFYIF